MKKEVQREGYQEVKRIGRSFGLAARLRIINQVSTKGRGTAPDDAVPLHIRRDQNWIYERKLRARVLCVLSHTHKFSQQPLVSSWHPKIHAAGGLFGLICWRGSLTAARLPPPPQHHPIPGR